MTDYLMILTTTDSRQEADKIAAALVERQLAACVQIVGPINSVYRWQGKVEKSIEWICLVKSDRSHYPQLEEALRSLHSYEVPEIVALPIETGSEKYLAWLGASLLS